MCSELGCSCFFGVYVGGSVVSLFMFFMCGLVCSGDCVSFFG